MICRDIQQMLLQSEQPDQPSGEVRAHLAGCSACRGLQRRLVDAERQIPLLPVPASTRRDQFLQQIRHSNVLSEPTVSPSELWLGNHRPPKERGLQKLAVSLALAASLALFALGWWAWPHRSGTTVHPQGPLVVRQQERDKRLAQAQTPRERVEVLANLAQGLHREARQLARKHDQEELRVVARFYSEVVCENLLEQARQLPARDRSLLGKVADQLGEVDSELQGLVADNPKSASAGPLREIATAARESHDQLRELLRA